MKRINIIFFILLSMFSIETYSQTTDTDGDGIFDHLDEDADNDGILNCIENGFDGDPNTAFKSNSDATAFTNPPGDPAPINQFRLTNGTGQRGQAWSYGKIDFAGSFTITMKVLLSDADGIAIVFQNDPLGTSATGINGQGLGARGIANGIALELDTFTNSCDNDENNGGNCDPSYDHGSIRITEGSATSGWTNLSGDGQLGDGTVDDGLWHTVVVTWNETTRNLSYTFDGVSVTNYTFPATGTNAIETIFGGTTNVRFGFTGSTGSAGNNNSIGFDNPCEIPLYFDTDGDGIPDYLDLDSDNDGCYDSLEGDGTYVNTDLNDDGSINTTIYPIDANGVPNNGNSQGMGQSQNSTIADCDCPGSGLDSDGDGIDDNCDLDNDNDGILDSDECGSTEKITNGVFPTSGGNTNTVPGWTVGGTYASNWPSGTGRVNLNSNGLEFRRDQATITTLSQNLTGVMPGASMFLNDVYWYRTNGVATDQGFTFTISYGGTVYATISSTNSGIPVVTVSNGAWVNIFSLPDTPNNSMSSKEDLVITFPYAGVPSSGQLLFTFTAHASPDQVNDLGFKSVSLLSCKDTDGDGIPDYLDLDSDGDGCPDSLEGDGTYVNSDLNDDGAINITIYPIDANGVPNNGNSQGIGASQNDAIADCGCPNSSGIDSDGDGIDDACDLDDDNDGILDTDECGANNIIKRGDFTNLPDSPGFFTPAQFATVNPDWVFTSTAVGSGPQIFWGNITGPFAFGNGIHFQRDGETQSLTQSLSNLFHYERIQILISKFAANNSNPAGNSSTLILSYAGVEYMRIVTANGINATSTLTYSNGASGSLTNIAVGTIYNNWTIDLPYSVPDSGELKFDYIAGPFDSDDFSLGDIVLNTCQNTDGDGIPNHLDMDSDGDGCPDAIEGDENVELSQVNPDGSINTVANGGVDADGVPNLVNSGGTADIGDNQGQGIGSSQNIGINSCHVLCTKPGTSGTPLTSSVGILTKGSEPTLENWPMSVPNGYLLLDGASKGMVITHMTTAQRDALTPVEGMMIYNTTENCVQIYRGEIPLVDVSRTGWNCIEQGCNEE